MQPSSDPPEATADGTAIIAHRGASAEALENTVAAFRLAWRQGADGIEGDLRLAADGVLVCMHDPDLRRLAGVPLKVARTNAHALAAYGIATFREMAATVPPRGLLYAEIKEGAEVVPRLLLEATAAGIRDRLVVIAFAAEVVSAVRDQAPDVPAYWLVELPAAPSAPEPLLATLQACRAAGISSSPRPWLDAAWVTRFHEAGYSYHVWTVDDPEVAIRLRAAEVASITTNCPGLLRRHLRGGTDAEALPGR